VNSRTISWISMAGCILLGTFFLVLRHRSLQGIELAREESSWRLTYDIHFEATTVPTATPSVPTEVRLAQPLDTPHCRVLTRNRSSIHPELTFQTRTRTRTGTLELVIRTSQPKTYDATATYELLLSPNADASREPAMEYLDPDTRNAFLRTEDSIPTTSDQVKASVDAVVDNTSTDAETVQAIFDHCASIETLATGESLDDVDIALSRKSGSALAKARAMVAMCRNQRIPARLVTGFEIKQQANAKPRVWLEVFLRQRWEAYDPEFGYTQYLPMNYVPVRRGGDSIVTSTLTKPFVPVYSIVRLPPDPRLLRVDEQHPLQIFDLTRLPVSMHDVVKILLLLPFAAFITAVTRNVVGIGTFGTFSPALLAMSFIYAEWRTGLVILLTVVSIGLVGRSFLERLRLLMVPRLSIILTVVILCVVFSLSTLYYMFQLASAQAVLLPMVIMTMLIERFHVTVDEDGMVYAIQLAVGTLLVAILCYAVLGWESVGNFVLKHPESHLFTIAAFIALGRYAGYRMTELWRFRDLVESPETVR
jgi:transglutaminase-like putative cysteine protease